MPRRMTPEDLLLLELAGDPQLSPDGRRLAFTVSSSNQKTNETRDQIFMVEAAAGGQPAPFTGGKKSDRSPRWSPDGTRLAFLSDRSGKPQIWLIEAFGGEARQLTRFRDGVMSPPVWSPDGTRIAFTGEVGPEGVPLEGDDEDESDLYKKYTKGVRRITRIHYKLDGVGFLEPDRHEHIFVITVAEELPKATQVTRGPWGHRSPAWSPDSRLLAVVATRREEDDYQPLLVDVWVVDTAAPDTEPWSVTPGTYELSSPVWSPDGNQIAFLGHPWESLRGYSSTHVYVVNRDGNHLRQVDRGWDHTFGACVIYDAPAPGDNQLRWTPDGTALISLGAEQGRQQVYAVDVESGSVTSLTLGDHCITSWTSDAACQVIAVGLTRPDVPGDLFLIEGPDLRRITQVNEALLADIALAPVTAFRFGTATGANDYTRLHEDCGSTSADGWIMEPAGFTETGSFPAILEVHGGPMGMYGWTFFMEFQCLAAAGYAVIYANPRGSQGYGQHFCACIREDWGNLDHLDVMAGLEAALTEHPWIDRDRLGIAGGSYGGFMTNWVVGKTDLFKAAVTMRSVVDESAMVGTSDYGFVDVQSYPTRPWEDMAFYRRVSPLVHVANIHTPLLIEHQEEDHRCPIGQAEQLYSALKVLRRTVEFLRYPESSHAMSRTGKPWLRVYRLRSIRDWFDRYIPKSR